MVVPVSAKVSVRRVRKLYHTFLDDGDDDVAEVSVPDVPNRAETGESERERAEEGGKRGEGGASGALEASALTPATTVTRRQSVRRVRSEARSERASVVGGERGVSEQRNISFFSNREGLVAVASGGRPWSSVVRGSLPLPV